ncbi:MAG: TldD/PmbA family protein [Pseudomonadota bacterium]
MTEPVDLPALAENLLDVAKRAGADAADVIVVDAASTSVGVRAGQLEEAERAESLEYGLRVLVGPRQAIVSASDQRVATLAEVAERAVAMARLAPEDASLGLADTASLSAVRDASALDLVDPDPDPTAAELEEIARIAESHALAVEGVSQVQSASVGVMRKHVFLAASNGFVGSYSRSSHGLSAVAIAGEGLGMERDYFGESRIHRHDLPSAEEVGRMAGERAVERLGSRKPPTGAFPVLYDERVASSLVGHLLAAVNGTAISRGASWLRGSMGAEVLPSGMSVLEEPARPRIAGSRPFDGEGLPCIGGPIVDDGVLTRWLLDLGTARKLGLASTGNAARGVGGPPSPSPSNIALTPGRFSRDDLIAQMDTGLLVTSMIGASINPNTGDYSRGASGFWVENGEITHPVSECTIAGNLNGMLKSLIAANDGRAHLSRVVPSLLVEGLTIAGA